MEIKIIKRKISQSELQAIAKLNYGEMVKGVADIARKIVALGGELHADAESVLLDDGSKQKDLWGFNIYPNKAREQRLEYTSFINIRPVDKNTSLEIKDEGLRRKVRDVVDHVIE